MRFDLDELAADELEAGAYETYESQALRNQFPQERSKADAEVAKEGELPEGEEYQSVVGSIAEYTMIPPPNEKDIASMNES